MHFLMGARFPTGGAGSAAHARLADVSDGQRRFGDAGEAMRAVSRLLSKPGETGGSIGAEERLVAEARAFFGVSSAVLLSVATEGLVEVDEMDPQGNPPFELLPVSDLLPLKTLVDRDLPLLRVDGEVAASVGSQVGAPGDPTTVLLLPMRHEGSTTHVLCLFDEYGLGFDADEADVARAFADAAAAGLTQVELADRHAAQSARQAALVRAAKALNASLDVDRTLARICAEAARILDADNAVVFVGDPSEGLTAVSVYKLPDDMVGARLVPGEGLAGQVAERGEPMFTNDYAGTVTRPKILKVDLQSALAVPMRLGGRVSGVLTVGYIKRFVVTSEHLALLEAFGELAAVASRNANAAAALTHAARTDSLTGCLNHAAFHEALRRELERTQRAKKPLSVAMLDIDHFKQVNDEHGHQVGDEVLTRVAAALQDSVRKYDYVGRYGGDEFAVVVAEASEEEAAELAGRAIETIQAALTGLPGSSRMTAGVAEWDGLESATELVDRADQALLAGKHRGGRGTAVRATVAQLADSELR